MAVCPYCKDVVPDRDACFCPTCNASHHQECWDANQGTCSVYGCESKTEETLLGCPFCEETFTGGRRTCSTCGEPLMNAHSFSEFLERYQWERLPLETESNPVLAAGYLRNNGIVARLSKKAPISMFGFHPRMTLWVPFEQFETAKSLLGTLSEKFQDCPKCGHTLFIDEEECSYCIENSGAKA